MTARQQFQKALMLLDRGAIDRGEATLRQVIVDAVHEPDQLAFVQGLVCLGDLLFETSRSMEARPFLEQALKEVRDDDLLPRHCGRVCHGTSMTHLAAGSRRRSTAKIIDNSD
ncbi:hypothetical protein [Burkholderia pyrrocinia]|uniref:hypothetical protein n=1 Tax=Burkholderia pyrrocinia TaxID=60550 RepID=UPI001BCC573F|nr:hypothetical protein [Burkholderia pyrrocinia]QVN17064.1 hypothetical protein JYG32_12310 [Burkholderia pyrrocinia]